MTSDASVIQEDLPEDVPEIEVALRKMRQQPMDFTTLTAVVEEIKRDW
jgi:hypothetical protein